MFAKNKKSLLMKNITLLLLTILALQLPAQDFYDLNTIQTIEITFAESNWDQLLDNEKAGDENYILAQSVAINGIVYDSVGVKYKGNSTYQSNQVKNPFHIELDTYKEHDHQGYKDIKLSNVAKDPSFLREVLSYHVLGDYMDAPKSNFANVYVNGNLIGLYSNSEAITKTFVNDRFGSKNGTFVKCNPPAGAGPQSNDFPNLVYLGEDSTDYYEAYEVKSDAGWAELIDLCDTLANSTAAIEDILDVDRVLWMLAFDNVLVNLDSYIGSFAQNYYLYRNEYGQFVPVVWDLNESFGRFSMTGSGNLNGNTAKQQMSPLLQLNDSDYPLIQELLNIPSYQKKYIAHCKTMLEEAFASNQYYDTGLMLQELIDASVQADNNKFFTYNNFLANLDSDISGGGGGPMGGSTIGIATLMDARTTYLLNTSLFTATAPTVSDIIQSENPIVGEMITISANINDGTSAYIGYRTNQFAPFTKVNMTDNGNGLFSADILVTASYSQYYIYSENDNAGIFSPQRAEHEYHSFTATSSNPPEWNVDLEEDLKPYLSDEDMKYVLSKKNKQTAILYLQSKHVRQLKDEGYIWEFSFLQIEGVLEELFTLQGKSERIKNFPYPRHFATLNHYFTWLFIYLLPLGLIPQFSEIGEGLLNGHHPELAVHFAWFAVPFSVMVSWVFHTMERIGRTGENPFEGSANDVPISTISRGIEIDIRQNLGEDLKDIPAQFEPVLNVQY